MQPFPEFKQYQDAISPTLKLYAGCHLLSMELYISRF